MINPNGDLPTKDEYFGMLYAELNAMVTHLESIQEKLFLVPDMPSTSISGTTGWQCYYDGDEFVIANFPWHMDDAEIDSAREFSEKLKSSIWLQINRHRFFRPVCTFFMIWLSIIGGLILFPNPTSYQAMPFTLYFLVALISTIAVAVPISPKRKSYSFMNVREFFMDDIETLSDLRDSHLQCKELIKYYVSKIRAKVDTSIAEKIIGSKDFIDSLPFLMDMDDEDDEYQRCLNELSKPNISHSSAAEYDKVTSSTNLSWYGGTGGDY